MSECVYVYVFFRVCQKSEAKKEGKRVHGVFVFCFFCFFQPALKGNILRRGLLCVSR